MNLNIEQSTENADKTTAARSNQNLIDEAWTGFDMVEGTWPDLPLAELDAIYDRLVEGTPYEALT